MKNPLFKNHSFLFLISAQTVSNLGDWLHLVALFALVAFKWHADPIAMAGITLCMVLPSILFGSPAGWLADRFNRKVLMSFSDFARCGCVLGIAFSVSLWQVYIFLFFLGFFSAVFTPAESGLLRQVVGENQIQAAIGTSEMINNSAKIIGPVAGGALISLTGIKGAFYLDAISFFLSAILLFGIKAPTLQSPVKSDLEHREKGAITEGFRFLSGFPVLKMGLIVFFTMILALQISDSQAMILIRDIKNATVHFASWCIAASGFGMLTASVLFTKIKLGEKLITLKISPAILGLGCIIVSTGTGWPIGIIEAVYPCVFFLMGFSFTMAAIPFDVLVQKKTPETHTGRVFGTINSLSTLAVLVGILLGGSLSEWFGVRLAFLISGGTTCLLAAVSAIAMKKAERKEIHVAEGIKTTS
ncbi:MFS transporter [Weizmannia sp. CD-2023]|uniref:MFS transporter n=1 Tax=Weizmannia sp. CD-2023 TaxID=3037263 RepID=UPI002E23076C|nr:MFS transporter [Weizmannia sp. CD-2023]